MHLNINNFWITSLLLAIASDSEAIQNPLLAQVFITCAFFVSSPSYGYT